MTVEPKEPFVGDNTKVKEEARVYRGKLVSSGKKAEVEKLWLDMEHEQEELPVAGEICE